MLWWSERASGTGCCCVRRLGRLETLVLEPAVPGGQAGTSSLIRNYLGFHRGVSGDELANRAVEQAWLFGTNFVLSQAATRLGTRGPLRVVTTPIWRRDFDAPVRQVSVDPHSGRAGPVRRAQSTCQCATSGDQDSGHREQANPRRRHAIAPAARPRHVGLATNADKIVSVDEG
jgi:hypothetical protein